MLSKQYENLDLKDNKQLSAPSHLLKRNYMIVRLFTFGGDIICATMICSIYRICISLS